ncbi:Hypothetical protein POVN_LOCUS494 [uncultured virus]|nr:Hypothetical protein POVN_LOCUS494 [uncultured virus]
MSGTDLLIEAISNIERLSGGPVIDLGAEFNVDATLKIAQDAAQAYSDKLAQGEHWGGNPDSTMTAAYPREVAIMPSTPARAVAGAGLLPLPLPLPQGAGGIPALPPARLGTPAGGIPALPLMQPIGGILPLAPIGAAPAVSVGGGLGKSLQTPSLGSGLSLGGTATVPPPLRLQSPPKGAQSPKSPSREEQEELQQRLEEAYNEEVEEEEREALEEQAELERAPTEEEWESGEWR